MSHLENPQICPKCLSEAQVREKTLLIGAASPNLLFPGEEQAGYQRKDQLAVDECKFEVLKSAPLEQFVDGYFCDKCGIGFLSEDIKGSIGRRQG